MQRVRVTAQYATVTRRIAAMMTTPRRGESAAPTSLLLAFELGQRTWKLGFSVGLGQPLRLRQIAAGAVGQLANEIARARARLGVPPDAPVISCYEAGRDGFWLHRYLRAHGIANHVVDSSSIEVNRRARRAKSDRLDLIGLMNLLARFINGDQRAWRVVRVPSLAEEDARHLPRTLETVTHERTRLSNRLKGLLATQGVALRITRDFVAQLTAARLWDGTPIPRGLQYRLTATWAQLQHVEGQLHTLHTERTTHEQELPASVARAVAQWQTLRAIGPIGAWVLATEIFGWREIRNGRQLGALAGLVPAPYQSGATDHDQGIARAGNAHVRRVIVQVAWGWLHYQPTSALSVWYQRRFGGAGRRLRKIGIVALARKLLIALWRYVNAGTLPDGAQRKIVAV
jgi:transposase